MYVYPTKKLPGSGVQRWYYSVGWFVPLTNAKFRCEPLMTELGSTPAGFQWTSSAPDGFQEVIRVDHLSAGIKWQGQRSGARWCVAMFCSLLQCVAVCCSALQRVMDSKKSLVWTTCQLAWSSRDNARQQNVLQWVAVCCSLL